MAPSDLPQDGYRYGPDDLTALAEQFTVAPVSPTVIRDRLDDGAVLVTTDVPGYLDRPIASDVDTAIALYRLVQLFGTPNVAGLEAGADQPERERTTWQYLFRVEFTPEDDGAGEPREHLLSVYDNRTNLSVGVSEWATGVDGPRRVPEPSAEPLPSGAMPDDEFLVMLVKLVLSTVEHAVEATYEGLHV